MAHDPPTSDPPLSALVVGGGIAGVTAAIALRKAGWAVTVFEKAPVVREVGAGITLWSNAIKALDDTEPAIVTRLREVSTELDRSVLRTRRGRVLARVSIRPVSERFGWPTLGVHRADLLDALCGLLPDGVLLSDKACTGYRLEPVAEGDVGRPRVTALFEDGSEATGDMLVGADGIHSAIRRQLLDDGEPRYAGYTAWRAIAEFSHPDYPAGLTSMTLGRGAQVGILPIGKGRTYWFATRNLPACSSPGNDGHKADVAAWLAKHHSPIPDLIAATPADAILRNDIIDRAPVDRWGEGPVTLIGDAAHPTTPNMGQGACQAIETAVALGRAVAGVSRADLPTTLRAHEQARMPRTAWITRQSLRHGRMFQIGNPVLGWMRNVVMRLMPAPVVQREMEKPLRGGV